MSSGGKSVEHFKALNELKAEYRDLEHKYNKQQAQLEAYEVENKDLKTFVRETASKKQQSTSHEERSNSPKQEAKEKKVMEDMTKRELEQTRMAMLKLQVNVDDMKSKAANQERTQRKLEAKTKEQEIIIEELSEKLQEKEDILNSLDEEVKNASKNKAMAQDKGKQLRLLKKQVIAIATEANKKTSRLQNNLQGNKEFIEGLQEEYNDFVETSQLEKEAFKALHKAEYDRLKNEFENYKVMQYEDKRQLLREQQAILYAMQTQFDEYRTTAEFLFNTEAAKLEEKLNTQMQKYDQEIKYIVRTKDQLYDDMITAKDAKIMSLIEGSDFQSLLGKHEEDMKQLQAQNKKHLEHMKTQYNNEMKMMAKQLEAEVKAQKSQADKYRSQCMQIQKQLEECYELIERKNEIIMEKEENVSRVSMEWQKQLELASSKILELNQEKEHLRHRIIKMQLDRKGPEGSNTIQSMVTRLVQQSEDLSLKYNDLLHEFESLSKDKATSEHKLADAKDKNTLLRHELQKRSAEYKKLTETFERFLLARTQLKGVDMDDKTLDLLSTTGTGLDSTIPRPPASAETQSSNRPGSAASTKSNKSTKSTRSNKSVSSVTSSKSNVSRSNRLSRMSSASTKAKVGKSATMEHLEKKMKRVNQLNQQAGQNTDMMNMGFKYLQKFKRLSQLYNKGEYDPTVVYKTPNKPWNADEEENPLMENLDLYKDLEEAEANAKLLHSLYEFSIYGDQYQMKLYEPPLQKTKRHGKGKHQQDDMVYSEKVGPSVGSKKKTQQRTTEQFVLSGTGKHLEERQTDEDLM